MKKIIVLILPFVLFLAGCDKKLDPHLYGTISAENFYQTPTDLQAATTAIYHQMHQVGWGPYMFCDGSSFAMDEVATGEWTTKWSWNDFLNGNWIVGDQMDVGFWNWINPAVTMCTYSIAKMYEAPVVDSIKQEYIAEVRALRAFWVYDVYRLYGPMPLIVDSVHAMNPDPNYKPQRPSADSVESFIVSELQAAAAVLPITQQQWGRVTKGAALDYLLKFYMHKKDWQDALNTANQIIGLGCYQLQSNYANIFSAQNKGNSEVIFVVTGVPQVNYGNHCFVNIIPGDLSAPAGNSVDGWDGHRMPWAFYDGFDPADKRRQLAWAKYLNKAGDSVDLRATGDIGALPLKYGIDPQGFGIWAGNDKILDRYAEVLLYKAEALNELNGPTQESIDLLNSVRARDFDNYAGSPHELTVGQFPGTDSLRSYILKERGWEFWYEGKRREDLIRMGNYVATGQQNASNFGTKNLLYPVPTTAIIENYNLQQNPGY